MLHRGQISAFSKYNYSLNWKKKKNPGSNNQKNAEGSSEQCTHIQYVRVNICVVCFLFVLLRVDVIAKKKCIHIQYCRIFAAVLFFMVDFYFHRGNISIIISFGYFLQHWWRYLRAERQVLLFQIFEFPLECVAPEASCCFHFAFLAPLNGQKERAWNSQQHNRWTCS